MKTLECPHDNEVGSVVGMESIRVFISSRLNLSNERRWAKDAISLKLEVSDDFLDRT